jgi:hypothetical protein
MTKQFLGIQISAERAAWIRSIFITAIVSSFVALFRIGVVEACLLLILHNMVLPFIGIYFYLDGQKIVNKSVWYKHGAMLGALIGAVSALLTNMISVIDFYFLGGRAVSLQEAGLVVTPLTLQSILFDTIITGIIVLIVSIGISALAGLVGAAMSFRKIKQTRG